MLRCNALKSRVVVLESKGFVWKRPFSYGIVWLKRLFVWFRFTTNIVSPLLEIEEFKGGCAAHRSLGPERLANLQRVAAMESIASSVRIEGARLTDEEVARIMTSDLVTPAFASRDEESAAGVAALLHQIFDAWEF